VPFFSFSRSPAAVNTPNPTFLPMAVATQTALGETIRHASTGRRRALRAAFTLVEAVVALALTAIAGSALLLGLASSLDTSSDAVEQTIAAGMAQQLLDEVAGARYMELGYSAHQAVLQASTWERQTGTRERFDDVDDYNEFRSRPPVDFWGVKLGEDDGEGGMRHPAFRAPDRFFDRWRQEIDVYYVRESDLTTRLPAGQVSDYRAIEVRVLHEDANGAVRPLATLRRVVAYVPPL
jgi:type II secretory pathway pseudopilin PulG